MARRLRIEPRHCCLTKVCKRGKQMLAKPGVCCPLSARREHHARIRTRRRAHGAGESGTALCARQRSSRPLLERAGRLVSKEQLVQRLLCKGHPVSAKAIEVYVHRLRKKIPEDCARLATVRGLGLLRREVRHG